MKVFVSVTTTKKRLGFFFYALQSLERQSYKDFVIVVNLSKDAYLFDEGIESIPDWMGGKNVRVNFVENTGSYRKLLPLLAAVGEDDLIVTADDDVLYSEAWLSKIVKEAGNYPDSIVCGGARRIEKNIFGRLQNYANWNHCLAPETSIDLLPIGVFGVAYRKRLLDLDFITDAAFLKYAPTADDIWFRLASMRKNTTVHVNPDVAKENAYVKHNLGLEEVNLHKVGKSYGIVRRIIYALKFKFMNYFGMALSKNDFTWKAASEYSRSRSTIK